ncbi:HFL182Cp [Eremothecium sinecaudum]|uniref:HFL182Cp n=1 Tax=Eremothecium sinecaudum TaxID=45286 RepID=A0A0X8HUD1_9SACH|nr:HFL182Cp [Eremothecium sinecaudum]AMD21674.1 HFL182Cp [Eremothecium sinecaudum]
MSLRIKQNDLNSKREVLQDTRAAKGLTCEYEKNISDDDINNIINELRRLFDVNKSVKEDIQLVDEQVRQTQLELESLVARSSNNNRHLQDLLLSTNDVRKLQGVMEGLTKQQETLRLTAVQEQERLSQLLDGKLSRLVETLREDIMQDDQRSSKLQEKYYESEKALALAQQELKAYKKLHGDLDELNDAVYKKKMEYAELQNAHDSTQDLLRGRTLELEELEERYRVLETQINDTLLLRYKCLQDAVVTCSENATIPDTSGQPISRITRVTSMLRSKYGSADVNRRVVSLSSVPTITSSGKPYLLTPISAAATNNSDSENTTFD